MPASPITSFPCANVNANGTGVAEGFATGAAESVPSGSTWKTSIRLPLTFVVTIRWLPSGVKPSWPGEVRKNGGLLFANPSVRAEPGIGVRPPPPIRKPWTIPVPPELSTYTRFPWRPTLAGNCPPEASTCSSESRSP